MTAVEMADYLRNDLFVSVENDVRPCLNIGGPAGGYFAVPRLVLGYVDYLGALYNGYTGRTNRFGRRVFADGNYARRFLRDIFGPIDPNYNTHADLLWEIFRNGTIHLYEPLRLQNPSTGRTIGWFCHKGDRSGPPGSATSMPHLIPFQVPHTTNFWMQPISIVCLYDDLRAAIQSYASLILTDSTVEQRFRQTADALQTPETTTLTW
jgi:hypothetical protein